MSRSTGPRVITTIAVVTMVVAIVGFILSLIANAFWFDEHDAYGEVPIPGNGSLHLPAGDVTVTFNTVLIGSSGNGLPVPKIGYTITGPAGVGDLKIDEDYGTSTTVNNDARRRIGYLHVPSEGSYDIEVNGNVSAYLNPTLTFGHGSNYGYLPVVFAGLFGFAIIDFLLARFWASRVRRSESAGYVSPPTDFGSTPTWAAGGYPPGSFTPSDDGIRVQQLNTLARLRDSGALTEHEFQAEKKRLLDGS